MEPITALAAGEGLRALTMLHIVLPVAVVVGPIDEGLHTLAVLLALDPSADVAAAVLVRVFALAVA